MIVDFRSRISDFKIHLLGLALAVVGYFGPWIPHKTAALTVTGLELAEFAKFFPQVQGGIVAINRVLFYLPLVATSALLALFSRSTIRLTRWIVLLAIATLLSAALLPYHVIDSVRHALATRSAFVVAPQYVGHLTLIVVGLALTFLAPLAGQRLPRSIQSILVVILALVGAIPALWQFVILHPLAVVLYDQPLGPGWGLIVYALGSALLVLSGIRTTQARASRPD